VDGGGILLEGHAGRNPFSVEELDCKYRLWVPARRFGLRQGGKVRPVDDFSEFGQNGTLVTHYRVDLGGVDEVSALERSLHSSVKDERVLVGDETGEVLEGVLHEGWNGTAAKIEGVTADLAKAFRPAERHRHVRRHRGTAGVAGQGARAHQASRGHARPGRRVQVRRHG
jgi:hypothetical protein